MTTALATRQQMPMPVQTMADLATMGGLIAQSGLLGAKNPAEGFLIAATCHQTGMSLLEFGETYHVYQGKVSMKADAMLARFNELGGTHKVLSRTPDAASIEVAWEGSTNTFSLSWDEAKEEPFVYRGGPDAQMAELNKPFEKRSIKEKYKTPRSRMQMLWARVMSDAIRTVCPQANKGSYTPEEVGDFNDAPVARNSEPIVISPEEAQSRVIEVNCSLDDCAEKCPIGGPEYVGKYWNDIPDGLLQMALDSKHAAITEDHKTAIKNAMDERISFP